MAELANAEVAEVLGNVRPDADAVFALWLVGTTVDYEWAGIAPEEMVRLLRSVISRIEAGQCELVPANTKH